MRIEDIKEGVLWRFLLEASKRYDGADWIERYADYAEKYFPGIHRSDFARRLREAKEAHSQKVAQAKMLWFLWDWPFHDWIKWYVRHMLANSPKR
jgi:hypothetical protein